MSIPTLKFSDATFDAVICLNGALPDLSMVTELAAIPMIAADGAANVLYTQGIVPEFVVGDMDSITPDVHAALRNTSQFLPDHDQELNDFEKALRFAQMQLWYNVAIYGLGGLQLEHTFNNWSVVMKMSEVLNLSILDGTRIAIPRSSSFSFSAKTKEVISILPQPATVITTTGLRWNLNNEELRLGSREGARNVADEECVSIDIHSGSLLFFCDTRALLAPKLEV